MTSHTTRTGVVTASTEELRTLMLGDAGTDCQAAQALGARSSLEPGS
ncbi:hypothetical protein [Streptomyces coeruleorubidus]|nr:hypothetical protein [Streptomyces bellus]